MIKKNQRIINAISFWLDGCLILISFRLATWLWLDVWKHDQLNFAYVAFGERGYYFVMVLYALVILALLALLGEYNTDRLHPMRRSLASIAVANLVGVLILGSILFIFRLQDFSRGVLAVFALICVALLSIKRLSTRGILMSLRKKGLNQKHIILVGTGKTAQQYIADLRQTPQLGYVVDGCFGETNGSIAAPMLGSFSSMESVLSSVSADEVIIAIESHETDMITRAISICEKHGVKVGIIPFYNEIIPAHPTIDIIGQSKIINLRSNPLENLGYAAVKRIGDIVISIMLLALLSPILVLIGIGTKLSSPGPVFFKQQRFGRNKRLFTMFKFRSMRLNADTETAWTTSNDPRRTRFGSFIRKYSLDELPQLFNVVLGDMSLIGPRPEIPFYVEKYKDEVPLYMVKHQIRPGMTGWAQVNGYRGDTSIVERIKHDVWYIENWSIGLDIKILCMTLTKGWRNNEQIIK